MGLAGPGLQKVPSPGLGVEPARVAAGLREVQHNHVAAIDELRTGGARARAVPKRAACGTEGQ